MSRYYSREQDSFTSLYVPPKPSCRRPLSRMVIGKSPRTPRCRDSLSPKPDSGLSRRRNTSEPLDVSSDGNNDLSTSESITDDDDLEELDPSFSRNQQTPPPPERRSPPNSSRKHAEMQLERSNNHFIEEKSKGPWTKCVLCFIVVVAMASGYLFQTYQQNVAPNLPLQPSARIINFQKSIRGLKERFPGQNRRTWGEIEAGVVNIINETSKPWTFVLFSNETKALSCLASLLGKASSEALASVRSLELQPGDLGDDYGKAIDRWKKEISDKRAVVVYDLLSINPRAIQAFHTMCDRENPLVEGAVYILTIVTRGSVPAFEKRVKFIEDQLTNQFINKVPEEKLQPLITRLTDGPIIPVKSEMSPANCQL